MSKRLECYVSVDIEASGPVPGLYSMLSIGACHVDDPTKTFYRELCPLNDNFIAEALQVSGFSLTELQHQGVAPTQAMHSFEQWLTSLTPNNERLVFVGLNATFDWSFINYYFWAFLGRNPFGISGLDIKAYYMGATGCNWAETTSRHMDQQLHPQQTKSHHALEDALYQAELFREIRQQLLNSSQKK